MKSRGERIRVGRGHAIRIVLGQPGQFGGHGAGVERDTRAGPIDVVAPHALGQQARLGPRPAGPTTGCPCRWGHPGPSRGRRSAGPPNRPPRRRRQRPRAPERAPRRRRSPRSSTNAAGPARSIPSAGGSRSARTGPARPDRSRPRCPTLVTVVPKSMVRITKRAPASAPVRPFRPGRDPGTACAPSPCRRHHPP